MDVHQQWIRCIRQLTPPIVGNRRFVKVYGGGCTRLGEDTGRDTPDHVILSTEAVVGEAQARHRARIVLEKLGAHPAQVRFAQRGDAGGHLLDQRLAARSGDDDDLDRGAFAAGAAEIVLWFGSITRFSRSRPEDYGKGDPYDGELVLTSYNDALLPCECGEKRCANPFVQFTGPG